MNHKPSRSVRKWHNKMSELYKRQNGKCAYCGVSKARLTIDHIIPRSKGGTRAMSNLQLLCSPCNSIKGNQHPYIVPDNVIMHNEYQRIFLDVKRELKGIRRTMIKKLNRIYLH